MTPEKIVEKKRKEYEEKVGSENPKLYRVGKWVIIVINHLIILLTFLMYFIFVFNLRRSFMNAITLMLILWLLTVYLSQDLKRLIRYWPVLTVY